MAIHFNYIKGLNGNVTKLSENTQDTTGDDVYTFIKWKGRNSNSSTIGSANVFLPEIYINKIDSLDGAISCGHIITSNATGQTFNQSIYLNNTRLNFQSPTNTDASYYIERYDFNYYKTLYLGPSASDSNYGLNSTFIFGVNNIRCTKPAQNTDIFAVCKKASTSDYTEGVSINAPLIIGAYCLQDNGGAPKVITPSSSGNIKATWLADGTIKTSSYIDALYFNATSDRRAKNNITPIKVKATDIVSKLPIYEFNYIDSNQSSIGMIAQEVKEFDSNFNNNFSLVNNSDASGENGDYMTIKESKLVYILWKAVQEQQEQIEKLQEQLNKLKESQ